MPALATSIGDVLLNSTYLEFYSSLGVQSERVGLDRLALLARTAGMPLALAFLASALALMRLAAAIWLYSTKITLPLPIGALPSVQVIRPFPIVMSHAGRNHHG